MEDMDSAPGGPLATRPLHFFWIVDCSSSMRSDGKIGQLNFAIEEAIPQMRTVAADNPFGRVMVRAVKFSNGAQWIVGQPTSVEQFTWTRVDANGVTDLGAALRLVADELRVPPMDDRGFRPILALVSDGQPTDDWEGALQALLNLPWGKKALRVALAIGQDADLDVLQAFSDPEIPPLRAQNPKELVAHIRWMSTVAVVSVVAPPSRVEGMSRPIPQPSLVPPEDAKDAVW